MSEIEDDGGKIAEARLWRDNGWTARVIKNNDDDGWAVEMIQAGQAEPALVGAVAAVDQADLVIAKAEAENPRPIFGRRGVQFLAFLDQRADPIGLAAAGYMAGNPIDDFAQALLADHPGLNGCAARRYLVDDRPAEDIGTGIDPGRHRVVHLLEEGGHSFGEVGRADRDQ